MTRIKKYDRLGFINRWTKGLNAKSSGELRATPQKKVHQIFSLVADLAMQRPVKAHHIGSNPIEGVNGGILGESGPVLDSIFKGSPANYMPIGAIDCSP